MIATVTTPLSHAIYTAYSRLLELADKIPKQLQDIKGMDGTGGKISVRDLLAYQIGWGTLLIQWYQAGLQGKNPQIPGEGFTKWDYVGLARHFYQKYNLKSFQEQLQTFSLIVNDIIAIVEQEHQTGDLYQTGVWPWCTLPSGKQWPLQKWITVNTVSPYKRAATLLKNV